MREECKGCDFWRGLYHTAKDENRACHFCADTGLLKTISEDGKCLSRKGSEDV